MSKKGESRRIKFVKGKVETTAYGCNVLSLVLTIKKIRKKKRWGLICLNTEKHKKVGL